MGLRTVIALLCAAVLAVASGVLGTGARAGAFPGLNGKIAFTGNDGDN